MPGGIGDDGHFPEEAARPQLHDIPRRLARQAAADLHPSLHEQVHALRRLGLADDGLARGELLALQQGEHAPKLFVRESLKELVLHEDGKQRFVHDREARIPRVSP